MINREKAEDIVRLVTENLYGTFEEGWDREQDYVETVLEVENYLDESQILSPTEIFPLGDI